MKLYTADTPNGHKASIMLEEIGIEYTYQSIDLGALEQKQDWFLELNPNGRIPVIVDQSNDNFKAKITQWLMFQMGGLGPMQGQAHVFNRYAPEKIPFAIDRYQKETRRIYEVYDRQLADNEFICGDYSIADIAAFPWVNWNDWAEVNITDLPNLSRWVQQLHSREAVKRGLAVPHKTPEQAAKEKANAGKGMLV